MFFFDPLKEIFGVACFDPETGGSERFGLRKQLEGLPHVARLHRGRVVSPQLSSGLCIGGSIAGGLLIASERKPIPAR